MTLEITIVEKKKVSSHFTNKITSRSRAFSTAAPASEGALPESNTAVFTWDAEGAQSYVCPPATGADELHEFA